MKEVSIFIETTWQGPAKRDGVAMWLVECKKGDEAITRQGFVHLENGTEAQGSLMAIINAFSILKKPCSALVFTQCEHVLHTIQNCWHIQWQKNDWHNAKGKPAKNMELWKLLIEKTAPHAYTVSREAHEYRSVMQGDLRREMQRWKP